jgi:hypothetical protein
LVSSLKFMFDNAISEWLFLIEGEGFAPL